MSVSTSTARVALMLTSLAALGAAATPALAAFPGENGRIAFQSDRNGGNREIHAMDGDGGNPANLTNDPSSESAPAWSADATRIAYVGYGQANLYVMNSDGSGQVRITEGDHRLLSRDPSWSPDGTRIAFGRTSFTDTTAVHDIWTIDPDGSDPVQLTDDGVNFDPAWSPDGTKIAFASLRGSGDDHDIFVMNADGSHPVRLTTDPQADAEPTWSPDGTRIAFTSWRGDSRPSVFVMDADGSGQTQLTASETQDEEPSWSPDGTKIAFTGVRDFDSDIFVMGSDGSGQVNITNRTGVDRQPDWGKPVPVPPPPPPPACVDDSSGAQEDGPVSGPLHGAEGSLGGLGGVVHGLNCDVVVPAGL